MTHWLNNNLKPFRLSQSIFHYQLDFEVANYRNEKLGLREKGLFEKLLDIENHIIRQNLSDITINGKQDSEIYGWRRGDAVNQNGFLFEMLMR